MSIKELVSVLPPPKSPSEAGTAKKWQTVESSLSLKLPTDLRDFGMTYGTGRFGGIQVFNPFSKFYRENIEHESEMIRSMPKHDINVPYSIYPDVPGLYPWGWDNNGHTMFWLIEDEPAKWPIILRNEDNEYERWDMPMTTFLAQALSNKIKCIIWTNKFKPKDLKFTPTDR